MTIEENLRPSPVSVTTPTTMPAEAQVVAALMAPIEPSAMARTRGEASTADQTRVATPEPDGPPRRKDESTTARPALLRLRPMRAREKSMKNFPAPDWLRKAP